MQLQEELHGQGKKYRPFAIYNLGRYERQWWQKSRLRGSLQEYRELILKFYQAEQLQKPRNLLFHGRKGSAFVYVHDIDSVLDRDWLRQLVLAAESAGIAEFHALAWEMEMELASYALQLGTDRGVRVELRYIPREVLEPNCTEAHFFGPGQIKVEAYCKDCGGKKVVHVRLLDFKPSFLGVPNKELRALQEQLKRKSLHFSEFIDFWAVDFTYHPGKAFTYHWCHYRLRQSRQMANSLPTDTALTGKGFPYEEVQEYAIAVKVIDVFGIDTTKIIEPKKIKCK